MNIRRRASAPAEIRTDAVARLLAVVDSESRPYTDPDAHYAAAERYQLTRFTRPAQPRQDTA